MARSFLKVAFTSCTLLCVLGARPELAENEVEASTEKEVHAHQHSDSAPPGALAEISEVANETAMACSSFCVTCEDGFNLFINRGQDPKMVWGKAVVAGVAGGLLMFSGVGFATAVGVAAGGTAAVVATNLAKAHLLDEDKKIDFEGMKDSCPVSYVLWGTNQEVDKEQLPPFANIQEEGIWRLNQDDVWCKEHPKQMSCMGPTTSLGARNKGRLADVTEKVLGSSPVYCKNHGGYKGERKRMYAISGASFIGDGLRITKHISGSSSLEAELKKCVEENKPEDVKAHRDKLDKIAADHQEALKKKMKEEKK